MTGMGTVVNSAAIVAGGLTGLLLKKGVPKKLEEQINHAMGIAVMLIGICGVCANVFVVAVDGTIGQQFVLTLVLALAIGSVLGYVLRIDRWFEKAGQWLSKVFARNASPDGRFAEGFVTATTIFCVGAMSVVGALDDGISNTQTTLYAKAILDGVFAIILANAYGAGVLCSSISVFAYQGIITVLAMYLKPLITPELLQQMSVCGSAIILCIGLNMLKLTKINTANLLPATFLPALFIAVEKLFT